MQAYWANRADTASVILDDELARGVLAISKEGFKGTAADLAKRLGYGGGSSPDLRKLMGQLRYLAPALEEEGCFVRQPPRSHGQRVIEIWRSGDPR